MIEKVKIRSKEHLFYYLTYRKYFPPPQSQKDLVEQKMCPDCNGSIYVGGQIL